jgi:hypothetical protein
MRETARRKKCVETYFDDLSRRADAYYAAWLASLKKDTDNG